MEDPNSILEDIKNSSKILGNLTSTFNALIPKDNPTSFDEFRLISICNCIYKITAKVIATRSRSILSVTIFSKQFGFFEEMQIFEAIGTSQEGLHTIKTKKLPTMVIKLDMLKARDRTNWLYLRFILLHVGFSLVVVNWIMACVDSMFFAYFD